MSATASAAPAFDPTAGVVEVRGLTKRFGPVLAVNDLSFAVQPGRVTGFLGPNGAGKTTTLRLLLGLATADAGTATIGGIRYDARPRPAHHVGSALEAASFHPGRTARDHLRVYAPQIGVSDTRCDEVLAQVGLAEAARRRVGGFSMGMRQRLALATTLLGDPQVLLLDEPANGLDPEGIRWLRQFLRYLAGQGRTVLVSSHVLSEVEQTVDDVVIIARGRLVHESSLRELEALARPAVRIVSPDAVGLAALVAEQGWTQVTRFEGPNACVVFDVHPAAVGATAFASGLQLHELSPAGTSLEQLFLDLTADPTQGQAAGAPWEQQPGSHIPGEPGDATPPSAWPPGAAAARGRWAAHEHARSRRMTAALRTELRKILTTRAWWINALAALGYMVLMGVILAAAFVFGNRQAESGAVTGQPTLEPLDLALSVYTLAVSLGYIFPALLGAFVVTTEFRHRTITPTLLAEPRRGLVLAAKLPAVCPSRWSWRSRASRAACWAAASPWCF